MSIGHLTIDVKHDNIAERLGHVLQCGFHVLLNVLQPDVFGNFLLSLKIHVIVGVIGRLQKSVAARQARLNLIEQLKHFDFRQQQQQQQKFIINNLTVRKLYLLHSFVECLIWVVVIFVKVESIN